MLSENAEICKRIDNDFVMQKLYMNGIAKFKVDTQKKKCLMSLVTEHMLALNAKILVVGIIVHTSLLSNNWCYCMV